MEYQNRNSDNINMLFDSTLIKNKIENNSFRYTQTVLADKNYKIILNNKNLLSDTVSNYITIINDQYPEITYQQLYDSINLKHLFMVIYQMIINYLNLPLTIKLIHQKNMLLSSFKLIN